MHKEVDELRRQIDIPLKSLTISLGIQNYQISREIQLAGHDQKSLISDLAKGLSDLHMNVENLKARESVQMAQLFTQATTWLKPLPFEDDYERYLSTLVPGSCEWLVNKDQFQDWMVVPKLDERYPLLWIAGPAGSGKTRLATKAIQVLRSTKRTAFFYCDAQDANKRGVNNILANWCWQLLSQDQSRVPEVNKVRIKHQIASQKALKETLKVLLEGVMDAVLVIDAFDECETGEQLDFYVILSSILELSRVLVFSRPLEDSFTRVKKATSLNLSLLEMSERDTLSDIIQYIMNEVAELGIEDDTIMTEITSALQSNAKGMFLWVALMLSELRKPRFDELEYLDTLNQLPKDLDNLYCQILENLSRSLQDMSLTRRIMRGCSFRRVRRLSRFHRRSRLLA